MREFRNETLGNPRAATSLDPQNALRNDARRRIHRVKVLGVERVLLRRALDRLGPRHPVEDHFVRRTGGSRQRPSALSRADPRFDIALYPLRMKPNRTLLTAAMVLLGSSSVSAAPSVGEAMK